MKKDGLAMTMSKLCCTLKWHRSSTHVPFCKEALPALPLHWVVTVDVKHDQAVETDLESLSSCAFSSLWEAKAED